MPPDSSDRYAVGRKLLGQAVRERRTDRGLTMQQLAEVSGLSFHSVYSLEHGRMLPSLPALDAVAVALGTSAVEVLRDVFPWNGAATAPLTE